MDIGDYRQPHRYLKNTNVLGKCHDVCVESIQSAADLLSTNPTFPNDDLR